LTQRHVWRLKLWHEKFPQAKLWTCGNIPKGLAHLPFAGILNDSDTWPDDFEQILFKGNRFLTEIFFYHKASKTVLMGDLIQNNKRIPGKPFTYLVFKLLGVAYPKGGVALDLKLSTNKAIAKESIDKILSWDFDKLILAHGSCIESNAKEYMSKAFSWLK
jgi:hypothetical protein